MWLNNQREILIDRWRRTASSTPREVRITERQREIIELIGMDKTNGEIAKAPKRSGFDAHNSASFSFFLSAT